MKTLVLGDLPYRDDAPVDDVRELLLPIAPDVTSTVDLHLHHLGRVPPDDEPAPGPA